MVYNKSELAKATGLSRVSISQILNNKQKNPKLTSLEKIADVLGCSVTELIASIKAKKKE